MTTIGTGGMDVSASQYSNSGKTTKAAGDDVFARALETATADDGAVTAAAQAGVSDGVVASVDAGEVWLEHFLAQVKEVEAAKPRLQWPDEPPENATPAQLRAYSDAMRRFTETLRRSLDEKIATGEVLTLDSAVGPAPVVIPDTVDGVETGFLNARYVTLNYLSRVEDLVENHPDVAEQVFNPDDPMHRFILGMVKNHDFEPNMSVYQDETDQAYAAEGEKLHRSGMMGGVGMKYQFASSPEVTEFMFGNGFVNRVESGVEDVTAQQGKITTLEDKVTEAERMVRESAARAKTSGNTAAQDFSFAWRKELAFLNGQLRDAELQMADKLQEIKNLESHGISSATIETLFNALFAEQSTDKYAGNLQALYRRYGIDEAEPYVDHGANSNFVRHIQQIAQDNADLMAKYDI